MAEREEIIIQKTEDRTPDGRKSKQLLLAMDGEMENAI